MVLSRAFICRLKHHLFLQELLYLLEFYVLIWQQIRLCCRHFRCRFLHRLLSTCDQIFLMFIENSNNHITLCAATLGAQCQLLGLCCRHHHRLGLLISKNLLTVDTFLETSHEQDARGPDHSWFSFFSRTFTQYTVLLSQFLYYLVVVG